MRSGRIATAVICALALGASTGCADLRGEVAGSGDEESTRDWEPGNADSGQNVTAVSTLEESAEAFRFSAPELFTGATVSGTDLYTSGPVVLTFVSPHCPISVDEGPDLADAAEYGSDITYVFVHTGGEREEYLQYVEDNDLYQQNSIHIDDSDLALWDRFGVKIQPSSVLVDSEGTIRFTTGGLEHQGLSEAADLLRGNT